MLLTSGGAPSLPIVDKAGLNSMELKIGDTFSTERLVTDELVRKFADVSGDYNPIHLDEEAAKHTRFGQRIAHGMLSGAFISAVLGYELSERRIVYLSQSLRFTAPVFIGDTITATGTVKSIREDKPIITLETVCTKQTGETVVTGEAVVMILNDEK
jgi:3-hydroxybutyryl-CoA dehydratase